MSTRGSGWRSPTVGSEAMPVRTAISQTTRSPPSWVTELHKSLRRVVRWSAIHSVIGRSHGNRSNVAVHGASSRWALKAARSRETARLVSSSSDSPVTAEVRATHVARSRRNTTPSRPAPRASATIPTARTPKSTAVETRSSRAASSHPATAITAKVSPLVSVTKRFNRSLPGSTGRPATCCGDDDGTAMAVPQGMSRVGLRASNGLLAAEILESETVSARLARRRLRSRHDRPGRFPGVVEIRGRQATSMPHTIGSDPCETP